MAKSIAQNCLLTLLHGRRTNSEDACMAENVPHSVSCVLKQSRLDGTQQDTCAKGESMKMSRREGRRIRRNIARLEKRWERSSSLGGSSRVFSFRNLYKAGKKCCNGVRWKHSVQNFETRLFSGTAKRCRSLMSGKYKFSPYVHFLLSERGKIRPIDAPRIQDRQVEKVFTRNVLLPTYLPGMIHNNGASLPGKGFHFSRRMLEKEFRQHFKKYGRAGGIILTDGKKFFPNASHEQIYGRHEQLIHDAALRFFADSIVKTIKADKGMPLGVEPSQAEMIAYASPMDNYMKCQMGLKGYGHYMDDFYCLVPPNMDWKNVLSKMKEQAEKCGVILNPDKTRYIPLTKPFRYCKAKYILTETGKVITRANRTAASRDKKKLQAFKRKLDKGEISKEDLWTAVNGMLAYLKSYYEHKTILSLRRLFFALYNFSCEYIENFREEA